MIWWHVKVLRHEVKRRKVMTVPTWEAPTKEILVNCSCGKVWTR